MRSVSWYTSGIVNQKAAEAMLEDKMDWFRKSFKKDLWSVTTSISEGPFGWRVELTAHEER